MAAETTPRNRDELLMRIDVACTRLLCSGTGRVRCILRLWS